MEPDVPRLIANSEVHILIYTIYIHINIYNIYIYTTSIYNKLKYTIKLIVKNILKNKIKVSLFSGLEQFLQWMARAACADGIGFRSEKIITSYMR